MPNTQSWQVSTVYSAILSGPHQAPRLSDPEPFLFRLVWQPIHSVWPSFTKFSIVFRLGRTPKCHRFQQQYGNSLSWYMIKREIISFLLAGGNPDKYHSTYVSVCNRSTDKEKRSVEFHYFNIVILRQTNHMCRVSGHGIYQVCPH